MRKQLRNLLDWMDKRFPEKVVVTSVEYAKMKEDLDSIKKAIGNVREERLKKIEDEINKFNVSLGFGVADKFRVAPFER